MTNTASASREERTQAMYDMIEAYLREPGISQREFCGHHQIALSTFYYYLAKYRQQQQNPSQEKSNGRFIPLTLPDPPASPGGQSVCELICPGGVVVRFSTMPNPAYLLSLIKTGDDW